MNELEKNIISIHKDKGKEWLQNLPSLIVELANKWNLNNLKPVQNLSFNYVLSGYQQQKPIILKISIEPLLNEIAALKAFSNYGAATIIDYEEKSILIERASPCTSLKSLNIPDKIKICCNITKTLHQSSIPKDHQFPHIRDQLAELDRDFDIPKSILLRARELKDKLLQNSPPEILLHGDLHDDNILQNGDSWLVIDPKGVIGYPINEVWAFIKDYQNDTLFVADYFGWSVNDVRDWYFVHLTLAAIWNIEDNISPNLFLDLLMKL